MSQYLQYIARIFVPTSGESGQNGTCYPIAPDRDLATSPRSAAKRRSHGCNPWNAVTYRTLARAAGDTNPYASYSRTIHLPTRNSPTRYHSQ
jgi:hypothetical protein